MFKKILTMFILWRAALFLIAFFATLFITKFGNSFPYYNYILIPTGLPAWIWGFGNFDGVHYLRMATSGYSSEFTQAFFPLYALLIKVFYLGNSLVLISLFISNIFFLASLYMFYLLIKIDYPKKSAFRSLILLLVFPTSFYFGSIYSESIFLFLTLTSFYLVRQGNYLGSGVYAALASGTRITGLFLLPVILIEFLADIKDAKIKRGSEEFYKGLVGIFLAPMGTLLYMFYLQLHFNNSLYFLTSQPAFGAQRSAFPVILLPQVLFRYIKIVLSTPVFSLTFFNTLLEVTFTMIPLFLLIRFYKQMRLSYWIFTFGCLILPTLTGTLSSMPRYALMSFLVFPLIVEKSNDLFKYVAIIMTILGVILTSLFIRGYWVS